MPLPEPQIDSRTYRQLLDEALARIPVHNPEYTNFNDADPGVTLLQLFAFMAESVSYRANLIPERNRRAFLRLLGVPLRAAEPARGLVAFDNPRGALSAAQLDAGQEVFAARVPFRTLNAVEVLPVEGRIYTKTRLPAERRAEVEELYERLYASHLPSPQSASAAASQLASPQSASAQLASPQSASAQLASTQSATPSGFDFYETRPFQGPRSGAEPKVVDLGRDTVDGALWLALLARPGEDPAAARQAIAGRVLTLGVVPSVEGDGRILPAGGVDDGAAAGLVIEAPRIDEGDAAQARYRRLELRADHDLSAAPGVAEVVLPGEGELGRWENLDPLEAGVGEFPPSLVDSEDGERLVTWLRLRAPRAVDAATSQLTARFTWIGINAAEVLQQAESTAELLTQGTGEPDQSTRLVNTPVLVESVRLMVGGEQWQRIDDLAAAAPEDESQAAKVFTVDRESGEVRFGDGASGSRPALGALIQASYAHGGGRAGMVGIDAVTKGPTLPAGLRVSNPIPTWGGDEAETVAEAERRIPRFVRHRDRLVSKEDFLDVVSSAPGVDLSRVEVLPLFHPDLPEASSPGTVTILVLPPGDGGGGDAPRPDQLFLDTLARHLEPRRLLTTELHVRGPAYIPVWVSLGIDVVPGVEQGGVRQAVERAVRRFLSPITGGFEEQGWPLRKAIDPLEIAAAASRVAGVSKVGEILLGDASGDVLEPVDLRGLELPRLAGLAVTTGDAVPLAELRGDSDGDDAGANLLPVPVVPSEC